jgi:hypothetical protein
MEQGETHRDSRVPPATTEASTGSDRQREGLRLEARATRWWAAYGGEPISNR